MSAGYALRLVGNRFLLTWVLPLLALLMPVGGMAAPVAPTAMRPEVEAFIDHMARRHDFDRVALHRVFAQVQFRPSIIRAMTAPATARPWYEFRDRLIDEARINGGVSFWKQHAPILERAYRVYGVPPEIIVAIIGIETRYGRNTGSFRVVDALATLAFDYPQRADYFTGELEQFLLLTREAGISALDPKGSYAGAMGIAQFMPSSYRRYAVDFDGDGRRDLWDNAADAIGSVANYLQSFGWRAQGVIVIPVDAGDSPLDTMLSAGIKPAITVGALKQLGIVPLAPVSDDAQAALFSIETERGPQFWLGLQNFYVITRYNRSINYAMAVIELARELRERAKQEDNPALE